MQWNATIFEIIKKKLQIKISVFSIYKNIGTIDYIGADIIAYCVFDSYNKRGSQTNHVMPYTCSILEG